MSNQNLKNYRKFYPLHHFVVYPAGLVLLVFFTFQIVEKHQCQRGVCMDLDCDFFRFNFDNSNIIYVETTLCGWSSGQNYH